MANGWHCNEKCHQIEEKGRFCSGGEHICIYAYSWYLLKSFMITCYFSSLVSQTVALTRSTASTAGRCWPLVCFAWNWVIFEGRILEKNYSRAFGTWSFLKLDWWRLVCCQTIGFSLQIVKQMDDFGSPTLKKCWHMLTTNCSYDLGSTWFFLSKVSPTLSPAEPDTWDDLHQWLGRGSPSCYCNFDIRGLKVPI